MQMPKFFTLSCPTCGSKLQIGNDLQRFACAFCGNEHIINREGGTISLFPVLESVERIQAGVDRTAIELTIARLERDVQAGRDAPSEIRSIKDYYTVNPKEPSWRWKLLWQKVAQYIQQKRNPNYRKTGIGKILNAWDGGMSHSDANDILWTLTDSEINDILQYISDPNFPERKHPSYSELVEHFRWLKELEELHANLPHNEAELQRLRYLLKS